MTRYKPIAVPISLKFSESDMLLFRWMDRGIVADFAIPDDPTRCIRVSFDSTEIIRILDEMPLSTEGEPPSVGLVREHFAYIVEDDHFWKSQSEAFRIVMPKAVHYRFVTGWTCLDVISNDKPSIELASLDAV